MDSKKKLTVKDWANEDRPREKMIFQGKKNISTAELIAILIRSGVPGKTAVDVAKEVLQLTGGRLTELSLFDHSQLANIKGLGPAKAATLMAALELGWRMQSEINSPHETIISDSAALFRDMLSRLVNLDHEEFWAVYLSNRRKVLARQRISSGGITETPVDIRILFRGAIENKAVMMAVLHNHPSGEIKPGKIDRALTDRIAKAGSIIGIQLIEHLIIGLNSEGRADYYSFHDNGEI